MSVSLRAFISLALLGLISAFPSFKHPLYIDQLEKLVEGPDKRLLDALDDDEYRPRSTIKMEFDVILERQSEKTKKLYADAVEQQEKWRHKFEEQRRRAMHIDDRPIYDQIRSIRADLSLSVSKAEDKVYILLKKIDQQSAERTMDDSHSGSHSDEDLY